MAIQALSPIHFSDAHRVIVDSKAPLDPQWWVDQMMYDLPPIVTNMMRARNAVAKRFGLRVPDDSSTLPFPVLDRTSTEVLLGLDDKHLSFRAALRVEPYGDRLAVTFDTVVRFNELLGRLYFIPVRPVHRFVVIPAMLRRAANAAQR